MSDKHLSFMDGRRPARLEADQRSVVSTPP
jgi:hypothetical protein